MRGAITIALLAFAVCLGLAWLPQAVAAGQRTGETLDLPFACRIEGGRPKLAAAANTAYPVVANRVEQPFTFCSDAGGDACTLMMVHKFDIVCDGQRVAWADVAKTAPALGIALPPGLPPGFAPVSLFAGRFMLPALARHQVTAKPGTHANAGAGAHAVVREELSPGDVIIGGSKPTVRAPAHEPWQTVVRSEKEPTLVVSDMALSWWVTWSALLVVAGWLAAWAWRLFRSSPIAHAGPGQAEMGGEKGRSDSHVLAKAVVAAMQRAAAALQDGWRGFSQSADFIAQNGTDDLASMVETKFVDVEVTIVAMPSSLLLRDVLLSEVAQLHQRLDDVRRLQRRRAPDKTAAALRAILRDLDRIMRIALTSKDDETAAKNDGQPAFGQTARHALPKTLSDAYALLGLNAEAPPHAAKKLVDALRMTWHPDFAQDEADRVFREERMKQINVAWDMVKAARETNAAA